MTTYDENLNENKFYKFLIKNHYDLLKKASEDNWIVCIPSRCNSFTDITETDVYEHMIVPSKTNKASHTLFKSDVHVGKNSLSIYKENLGVYSEIKILFRETIYLKSLKFNVYCTDNFLNRSTVNKFLCINTLRDSIDFLWEICGGKEILFLISNACDEFLKKHANICYLNKVELSSKLERLYLECFDQALLYKGKFVDEYGFFEQLKLSVGTYIQHCLFGKIFIAACFNTVSDDIIINKEIRKLQFKKLDFSIKKFHNVIPKAKVELGKINSYSTCLGKLNCLKNVFDILNSSENVAMTSSILFEVLLFLISKLNINNWYGNFTYMRYYSYGLVDNTQDLNNFLITQLEGVLEYLRKVKINIGVRDIIEDDHKIFTAIYDNNIDLIKGLLKNTSCNNNEITLCHPLCDCSNCEKLLSSNNLATSFCDKLGRNCLHVACIFGHPNVVELLIRKSIDLNKDDSFGFSPIHYAASFGNQEVLLLLLKAQSDLNIQNFEGNTALHLAVDFGHINCVETILIYAQTKKINVIDCVNKEGNTALHLASQRNYVHIIQILLEYNFDLSVRNKCDKLAFDLTSNVFVKLLLNKFKDDFNFTTVFTEDFSSTDNTNNTHFFGIKPSNAEQIKKTDLLLKAVENNDLPLTCFYLGISSDKKRDQLCHPLCNCSNCSLLYQDNKINCDSILNVNVCNMEGFTPLHYAAKFGRKDIVLILLKAGANINVLTYKTLYSPLHIACMNEQILTAKELLYIQECGVNLQDYQGNTALHHAVNRNNAKLVQALLNCGCNFYIKNCNNRTALDESVDKSYFYITTLIEEIALNML